ncbi:hypothetical protein BD560DRAFT_304586, partial [Blakeslea trispora]
FWKMSVLLPVRDLGYRTFNIKLPSSSVLSSINVIGTPGCLLCNHPHDSFSHFTVECPARWSIWSEVMVAYYPYHFFLSSDIFGALKLQSLPPNLHTFSLRFLVIVFSTHWTAFWRYRFEQVPLDPLVIIKRAIKTISLLT